VLKNDVFKAVSHDILDEMLAAYNKSDVSKNITAFQNENGTFTSDAATDLLKHLDVVRLLQRSIESGKPIIDDLRREDSTIPIAVVNYLIGMTPVVWKDPRIFPNHWCHADEVVNNSTRYGGILSPEVINNWFATFDTPLQ
jgi:hypothetical protein